MKWFRVTKREPCRACGRGDWCIRSPDGSADLCMRVVSENPHTLRDGSTGYIHRFSAGAVAPRPVEKRIEPAINVGGTLANWSMRGRGSLVDYGKELGVSPQSLRALHATPCPVYFRTWAFPMRDGYNNLIGIRLRNQSGRKWAIEGSHNGIFLPQCEPQETALVCEGPTDTAAALSMGFFAIGRPSCTGGGPMVITAVKRLRVQRVAIVADNDGPGLTGALSFAKFIPVPSAIVVLPCKDVRQFINNGGTRELLLSLIGGLIWRQHDGQRA